MEVISLKRVSTKTDLWESKGFHQKIRLCIETCSFIADTGWHSTFLAIQLAKCFTVDKN
ncbi:16095_t:CDS:2, partial [Entrophospora sp. SA101]